MLSFLPMRRFTLFCVSVILLMPFLAQAVEFSDVPKTSVYYPAIQALSNVGVITGNPDGTFLPQVPVNRAALLMMAYKAANREPAISSANCFPNEFKQDAWFAMYVCDAVARRYVRGYGDGTFRPQNLVTVGEALKMIYSVLELPAPPVSAQDVAGIPFRLSAFHWSAPYVVAAYRHAILPLPGQEARYFVDDPIDRGQVAEMMHRALLERIVMIQRIEQAQTIQRMREELASSKSSASSYVSSKSSSSSVASQLPWSASTSFVDKNLETFNFVLEEDAFVEATVTLHQQPKESRVDCVLRRLSEDGNPSDEFYTGLVDANACYLRVALEAGTYQWEMTPGVANAQYTASIAKAMGGDGNDGVSQAVSIDSNRIRSGYLGANDLEDWYVFTVPLEARVSLDASGDRTIGCAVYPWTNVDLPSFEIPVCNTFLVYPAGTYYVRIKHGLPRAGRQTYTIILRTK